MIKIFYSASLFLFFFFNSCCRSPDSLDLMTTQINQNVYTNINSVLIWQGGQLRYEHYFNGFGRDSLHDTRSSFKSITSLLMGIAIDQGLVRDVYQKVYSFFPEYQDSLQMDKRKKGMTIKNLLEMQSGYDCDEWDDVKDCESEMIKSEDWVKFSLSLPMKNDPGKVWAYTSCNPMVISGVIAKASGVSIMDFAKKFLFDPLGITGYTWTLDPAGHGMTAGSFYIRPLDMLKIGELVLDKGVWNGKRIVSEKWLEESTRTTIPIPDFSYVRFSRNTEAIPQPSFYGYYWYSETVKTKKFQEDLLFASGNGGQYIMIIKNLGMVIVFTQSNYNHWQAKRAFDLLIKYILPSFEPKN